MNLTTLKKDAEQFESEQKNKIISTLRNVNTHNDKIKKLSANTFIISSSQLKNNIWSPEYYDYDKQIDLLVQGIESRSLPSAISFLEDAINNKFIKIDSNKHLINEDVVNRIRRALENE